MDPKAVKSDSVLILDFGSQYTHLITRRIRSLSVFSLCISGTSPLSSITSLNPKVVILSGGPHSVHADDSPSFADGFVEWAQSNGVFVLGICYGLHLLVQRLGGEVRVGEKQEYGRMEIETATLPNGFEVVARSQQGAVAAVEDKDRRFYGLQYHPEVTHSPEGMETLRSFLFEVCGVNAGWKMENVMDEEIKVINNMVGPDDHVICALSGGVDSTVAATLVHKAIGDRLHCVFVDNGLLRYKERERVMETFERDVHLPVTCVDATEQFLSKLKGVVDPELKRKIIGKEFICVFDAFAKELENNLGKKSAFLVQGTLYPDVIESCPNQELEELTLTQSKVIIMLEVRQLGRILSVPYSFLKRHPFPGPGLAVRVLGDVTEDNALDTIRQSIKDAGIYDSIWQAFAVFLPVKSVGVQGNQRTHSHVVALRAVTSQDGMTADWYVFIALHCFALHDWCNVYVPHLSQLYTNLTFDPFSHLLTPKPKFSFSSCNFEREFLDDVVQKICNNVRGVNCVALDITSKPPSTIEWE
ncbi:GMP synthase [glutamine-hydrolyzing]-like [Gossypium australe]|uniref:GMP synthase (glutamine-hydrolyzing) n=1 Tax=Gossypium australe TaxID=47621 RepID=A0A5B6VIP6_9ROSI|nr:GMP synthase [glutamine-hydrolyzing]-like [Gossypium australe]